MPIDKKNLEEMSMEEMIAVPETAEMLVDEEEVTVSESEIQTVGQYMHNGSKTTQSTVTEKKQVGRRGGQRSEKATEMIASLDEFFGTMKSGDKVNNHDLVRHLDSKGFEVSKSAIPTDVPLNYAPKTQSMENGTIIKEKDDPAKKRPMWVYRKV